VCGGAVEGGGAALGALRGMQRGMPCARATETVVQLLRVAHCIQLGRGSLWHLQARAPPGCRFSLDGERCHISKAVPGASGESLDRVGQPFSLTS